MTRNRMIIAGVSVLILCFITAAAYTSYAWESQNFRADGRNLIYHQLQMAHPGYKPRLIVRVYGQDARSRDLCIYEMSKDNRIIDVWSVLYTRGLLHPLLHEIYTPAWSRNGGLQAECLRYSIEAPPSHGFQTRLAPREL